MQVIKSENYSKCFTNESLNELSKTIQKLENKMICNNCIIKGKSFDNCELETLCPFSDWNE
jgi:hypothetical protein